MGNASGPGSPKQYHEWSGRQKADSFDAIEIKGSILESRRLNSPVWPVERLTGTFDTVSRSI